MRFLLQQGYGMMQLTNEFVRDHPGVGVILSPRACKREQLERHAREIRRGGGAVYFDPQFYEPRTDHERIRAFNYWTSLDFTTAEFDPTEFCKRVVEYQLETIQVDALILPGRFTNTGNSAWRDLQAKTAETECSVGSVPRYMTVALGPDVVINAAVFDLILDEMLTYPVNGFYVLLQHPRNRFLAQDESYLYALLDGFLSVSRSGKELIIGYANQQGLIYAAAGVETIASGNFRNVRAFNPEIFRSQEPGNQQRSTWYYDAGTLGEYRAEQLSLAYRRGLKGRFGPTCEYCEPLVNSNDPARILWSESDAFRHFLNALYEQWMGLENAPRGVARADAVYQLLLGAIETASALETDGFRPGDRGFLGAASDATIAAVDAFRRDRTADLVRLRP